MFILEFLRSDDIFEILCELNNEASKQTYICHTEQISRPARESARLKNRVGLLQISNSSVLRTHLN